MNKIDTTGFERSRVIGQRIVDIVHSKIEINESDSYEEFALLLEDETVIQIYLNDDGQIKIETE